MHLITSNGPVTVTVMSTQREKMKAKSKTSTPGRQKKPKRLFFHTFSASMRLTLSNTENIKKLNRSNLALLDALKTLNDRVKLLEGIKVEL